MSETGAPLAYEGDFNGCYGCGPDNPSGLHLRFLATDNGVEVRYTADEHLCGAPGIIHGGVQATLLDETLCMTAYAKRGRPVVTGELSLRYRKPVATGVEILVRGWIVEDLGRSLRIEGAIEDATTGEVLTSASGRFFDFPE